MTTERRRALEARHLRWQLEVAKILPRWVERVERARQVIGDGGRERLKWLVEHFLREDLAGYSDARWRETRFQLFAITLNGEHAILGSPLFARDRVLEGVESRLLLARYGFSPEQFWREVKRGERATLPFDPDAAPSTAARQQIIKAQNGLRHVLKQLAERRRLVSLPRSSGRWLLLSNSKHGRSWRLRRRFEGPLLHTLVFAATDLLIEVGLEKLRACPLVPRKNAPECGLLFIATRRQRYCSIEHARVAAYHAWKNRERQ